MSAIAATERERIEKTYALLDVQLAQQEFIAAPTFSIADIIAYAALELARLWRLPPSDEDEHLMRWYKTTSKRPSAKHARYLDAPT